MSNTPLYNAASGSTSFEIGDKVRLAGRSWDSKGMRNLIVEIDSVDENGIPRFSVPDIHEIYDGLGLDFSAVLVLKGRTLNELKEQIFRIIPGAEFGEDNDGQIVIHTRLTEAENGKPLVKFGYELDPTPWTDGTDSRSETRSGNWDVFDPREGYSQKVEDYS